MILIGISILFGAGLLAAMSRGPLGRAVAIGLGQVAGTGSASDLLD